MSSGTTTTNVCENYTIAWTAALPHERAAGTAMLDERHEQPQDFRKNASDPNSYSWGRMGKHGVVIASLPAGEYGLTTTAVTVQGLRSSLPHIRFGLLVGIGAGVPGEKQDADGNVTVLRDIRLGDVVVSNPEGTNGGVVQYDFMKAKKSFERKGFLNSPPQALRNALSALITEHELEESKISEFMTESSKRYPKTATAYARPGLDTDRLFKASYEHDGGETCDGCLASELVNRSSREHPKIHYGTIASGNTLVKNAAHRDEILTWLKKENVDPLCFEMEAAGLMNIFPCMVIRGICDYGDAHKNDIWQRYAAIAAAAFGKEMLSFVDAEEVRSAPQLRDLFEDIKSGVDEIRTTSTKTHSLLETSMNRDQLEEIYRWFSPSDPSTNYNKALEQRLKGTGRWFANSGTFRSFKEGNVPFLWLNGIPGCGKTVLSSSIIEDLQQRSSDTPSAVLYFYFDFNDSQKQTLDSALRSLLWQTIRNSENISMKLQQLYESCESGKSQPSTEALVQSLGQNLQMSDRTIIVLDALDECTTRSALLPWLAQMATQSTANLKIIATSRREHDIEVAFESWLSESAIVPLQQLEVDADIGTYVSNRLRTDRRLRRWQSRPDVQYEIETALMNKANGTFRWATCQLDELAQCVDYPMLREALGNLPRTLDDTYARILDQIPEIYREKSIKILQVLTWSERPLRIEEAVDFLAVSPGNEPGFDEKDRMPVPREILMFCSSLVTIVSVLQPDGDYMQTDANKNASLTVQEMRLSHFSVKEYLSSDRLDKRFGESFCKKSAARCIASVSLTYLLHLESNLNLKELWSKFPLSRYSAEHWMNHARLAGVECTAVQEMAVQLLSDHQRYARWRSIYDPDHPKEEEPGSWLPEPWLPEPLYYASLEGLEFAAIALIEKGADINGPGGFYDNALCAACEGGYKKVVAMLLEKGAYVKDCYSNAVCAACEGSYENAAAMLLKNALYAACEGGYEKVAATLLERGADVNAQGRPDNNALCTACFKGHEKVIQVLLDNDANMNTRREPYNNALQAACHKGHEKVVQILLDKDANVNAQGGQYGNALQAACHGGHEKVVQILLDKDANVNAEGGQTGQYGNALQTACHRGYEKVAQILLDKGAHVNCRGKFSPAEGLWEEDVSALYVTVYLGYERMAELLTKRGAAVDAPSKSRTYSNALQAACAQGREDIAEMLLTSRADPNIKGSHGWTALHQAAYDGHKAVISLLLAHGAEVEAQNDSGDTALHIAARWSHDKVLAQLLLAARKASVEIGDSRGQTALHVAAHRGDEPTVSQLLSGQADPNARDQAGETPLHVAAGRGHMSAVKALLNSGADIDAGIDRAGTPLHTAIGQQQAAMVELLLDEGTKLGTDEGAASSVLLWAADSGHRDVVQLLIKRNLRLDAPDKEGRTALHYAADRGNKDVVIVLLQGKADANVRDNSGKTPLRTAVDRGYIPIVELFLQDGQRKGIGDDARVHALYWAVEQGHESVVRLLLEGEIDWTTVDNRERPLLHRAVDAGHISVLRLLLQGKFCINAKDRYGKTALHRAVDRGHGDVVQLLLESGADANVKDSAEETALHSAVERNCETVVRLLLTIQVESTNVNSVDRFGRTALHLAAGTGHGNIVRLLLQYEADPDVEDQYGQTAFQIAYRRGSKEVERLFLAL